MSLAPVTGGGSTPEPGQLVRVRGDHWVVAAVEHSTLPPDVLAARPQERATVVRLSNVGDDRLGDELDVVWEREPEAVILESATLPTVERGRYDDPAVMAAFLDAVRWGAVTSADAASMQAPFRSGVRIEDYQLDPVVRALRSPRANLLIADDVGLGKTIETGLVAQEMILRQRARRIIVVVPADLTTKWKREMAEKFGLDFHIVDTQSIKELRRSHGPHANPWAVWPRTIVSLPWLRGERGTRALDDFLPAEAGFPRVFDLLIVDEAHHLAPSGTGRYAIDSQQTKTMRRLAPHCENRLFLTATPHNGYSNSFAALLELLDPQRFARGTAPDKRALAEVMIRRTKDDPIFIDEDGRRRFPERNVRPIEFTFRPADIEAQNLLAAYTAARTTTSGRVAGRAHDMITMLLKKRLFSSPAAFASTLRVHADTSRDAAGQDWTHTPDWLEEAAAAIEDDFALDAERDAAEEDLLGKAAVVTGPVGHDQKRLLDDLLIWAERHGQAPDAKAEALLTWLRSELLDADGEWTDERVVVFTEYRTTQRWLKELLDADGLGGEHLSLIYGGQDDKERQRIKDAFQAAPDRDPVRILLATDSASEGIDLQKHCHRLVNYDIPFNPNRLDQRIGRVDRYGQKHDVDIRHFVSTGWQNAAAGSCEADLEFLSRVATKISTIREDLGKVNRLITAAIEARMTGHTDAETLFDSATSTPARDLLAFELQTRERVQAARAELTASIENLRVAPTNVERVVATALDLAGQSPLTPANIDRCWIVGDRTGMWTRATENLPDPLDPTIIRPVTFDPDIAADHDEDVVLAHLGHPLVADATRLLRAKVWAPAGIDGLRRVAVCVIPDDVTGGKPAVAGFSRLVIAGGDGYRLHEEVFAAGGTLDDASRWTRLGVQRLESVLNQALDATAPADMTIADQIAGDWDRLADLLRSAYEARAGERYESLVRDLAKKKDSDVNRIREVLTQLQSTIENALRGPRPEQLELFDDAERDQYVSDKAAWERRLAEIPAEIERETAAIEARYANLARFVFPAAIVIALPASLARGVA
jgi:superfamily II DNA or RNA helicase